MAPSLHFLLTRDGTRRARQLHTSIDTDTTRPKAEEWNAGVEGTEQEREDG